jgi:hypothetical protein
VSCRSTFAVIYMSRDDQVQVRFAAHSHSPLAGFSVFTGLFK